MRYKKLFLMLLLFAFSTQLCLAAVQGRLATNDDIALLKKDLQTGHLKIGKTRFKQFSNTYGLPDNITDADTKITLEYEDLKVEFNKNRYWRDWSYDSTRKPAYSDDINDLRKDLESEELVGQNITIGYIEKEYESPTEALPTDEDGNKSIYYYGDIKLVFENVYTLKSWKGKNFSTSSSEEVPLASKSNVEEEPKKQEVSQPKEDIQTKTEITE